LSSTSAWISIARSAAAVSVVKYGLPVPGPEDHDATLLEVPHRAAPDVRLGDLLHLDRRQHPRVHAALLERVLQRQRVHHRRQHAHVVGAGAVHARGGRAQPAKDVAAADDHRDLDPEVHEVLDLPGDRAQHLGVDAVALRALQGLAGQFQEDPLVARACVHAITTRAEGRRGAPPFVSDLDRGHLGGDLGGEVLDFFSRPSPSS
jgi:hypothetical protein